MKYLLDTDHISFLQRRTGPEYAVLSARIAQHTASDFATSVISINEQTLGAHTFINHARPPTDVIRGYRLLLEIVQGFQAATVMPFDAPALAVFDGLRSQQVRIATMDLRIAAIALSSGLTLLTRNSVDFNQVPGLVTENWTV